MLHHRSISVDLLLSLFSGARHQGLDLKKLFADTSLIDIHKILVGVGDSNECNQSNESRIDLDALGPVLRKLWHAMEDEASGFLRRPFKIGMFSMMCHAIITSGNLRRALLRSARFLYLLNDDLAIELQEEGDDASLIVHYSNPHKLDSVFFITSIFVIWIRLSCWLVQRSILLERIEFSFSEPNYSAEFDAMFPCRHRFSQTKNAVTFNKKFLSLPIMQDSETLSTFLQNAPESLLTQYRQDNSISAQIKRLLIHRNGMNVQIDNLSFEDVSDELGVSTHTIRRRLKEEGNRFQEIKDSVRREQAITLLEQNQLNLQEITEKLGFSETAAFNRAFKKWTGQTPGSFRVESI